MSAHLSPAKIHSGLKHPVVDADGHWLEYAPVFSEQMRKAHGNKAADGFLADTSCKGRMTLQRLVEYKSSRRKSVAPAY